MLLQRFLVLLCAFFILTLSSCSEEPPQNSAQDIPEKHETAKPTSKPEARKDSVAVAPSLPVIEQVELQALQMGEQLTVNRTDKEPLIFDIESARKEINGTTVLTGSYSGTDGTSRFTATVGNRTTFGRIQTPQTTYTFTVQDGKTTFVDLRAEGNQLVPKNPDDAIVPTSAKEHNTSKSEPTETETPPKAYAPPSVDGKTTIDLMIVYSDGFAQKHPGDAAETRLQHLVSVANSIYTNSGVDIFLRLVHTVQISYPDNTSNGSALDALTGGTGVFSGIEDLRQEHGADLVSLVRPYDNVNQQGCGIAWLLGTGYNGFQYDADHAYSVVSDGSVQVGSWTYYCSEQSLVHELGHNMGSAHDRAHASNSGVYSYSYGYGVDGDFGTVMSYIDPEIDYFSTPHITCDAGPPAIACGVDEGHSNSANNALSLNNTASSVADFVVAKYSADVDGDGTTDATDTIQALQLLTGQSISGDLNVKQDVNGDGKIGLPEAIHSLQQSKN